VTTRVDLVVRDASAPGRELLHEKLVGDDEAEGAPGGDEAAGPGGSGGGDVGCQGGGAAEEEGGPVSQPAFWRPSSGRAC